MLKTTFLITIFLTVCSTVFSQFLKLKCGDDEIDCENGNMDHFEMIAYCPFEETDTMHLPRVVMDNAKKYLINRIGVEFYGKLKYHSCQLIDFKNKKLKCWISKKSDRRVNYAIQYYFNVQDSMRYYLSLVFDKHGNIISKHQLPNCKKDSLFDKIINVCNAKLIAEKDTVFPGELQNISLEYLARANTFVWRAEKPAVPGKKARDSIHRFILINARSGTIIKRETESCSSFCNGGSL